MLAENDIVEDAPNTEDIADGLRLCWHILNIDDFWSDVTRCPTSDKEIVGVICNSGQTKVDYNWLFTQNDVIGFQIAVDDVLAGHLSKAPQYTLHDEFSLVNGIFREVIESSAYGVAINKLQSEVNWIFRLIDAFQFHQVGVVEHLSDLDLVN